MRLRIAILLATLSGFVGLSYEILWVRIFSYLAWGKAWSFGVLLGAYLTGIAFGAAAARRYCGSHRNRELKALALSLLVANVLGFLLVPALAEIVRFASFFWCLAAVAVVAGLLGTGLPLISHFGIPADDRIGARLSYLYVGNIAGSAAGSLLTGFIFLDAWPIATISLFLLLLGLAMAAAAALLAAPDRRRVLAALGGFVAVAVPAAVLAPRLYEGVYEKMQFKDEYQPGYRFAQVFEGKSGVITVTKDGVVYGDGVYDGRFSTDLVHDTNGIVRAYAIAALREAPREVLVIGLGSGSWAQVLVHHPAVEHLVAVEINPGYLELMKTSPVVRSLLTNPKVELVVDDGRRWITRTDRKFDLIVQNTTYHFRSHATNLLSTEYFEICRARLEPGGLLMFNTTWSKDAARTGATVFPHAWMIITNVIASDAPLPLDRERLRRTLETYRIDDHAVLDLARPEDRLALDRVVGLPQITDLAALDAHEKGWTDRATLLRWTAGARVITDDNMASEFARTPE